MATRRALLLIADIGGYTEYMQFHRSILGHAEAATSRMLDKVVDAARDFDLIEIEGDAAFLSREVDGLDGAATLATVTQAAVAMHRAFHEQRRLIELNMCPCGSCTQTSALKLKFVAHVGEVATQTIKRRRKLVGIDVIYVHRLLKNAVQVPEYVLVSEELYRGDGTAPSEPAMQELTQDLEGIGPVRDLLHGRRGHRRAARVRCRIRHGPSASAARSAWSGGACRTSSAGAGPRSRRAEPPARSASRVAIRATASRPARRAHGVAGHGGQEGRRAGARSRAGARPRPRGWWPCAAGRRGGRSRRTRRRARAC